MQTYTYNKHSTVLFLISNPAYNNRCQGRGSSDRPTQARR